MSAEPPSAQEEEAEAASPPPPDDRPWAGPPIPYPAQAPPAPPGAYPPTAPPYPPEAYPPTAPPYPQGAYPPYAPPPPGSAGGGPRQHAWRTPWPPPGTTGRGPGGPGPGDPGQGGSGDGRAGQQPPPGSPPRGAPARTSPRSVMWVIVAVAVGAILVRSHRLSTTDIILFCILVPSVILHEISHGLVALVFGDDTAKRAGRLSLNPLRHVTAWGTIIVPAITILSGLGYFGWAKPVPVNVGRLRSPRNHGVLVALVGPLTNVVIAAVFGAAFYFLYASGRIAATGTSLGPRIVFDAGIINLWVACFNMIPIPPLDGSALVERLLPAAWWPGYLRVRPFGMLLVLGGIVLLSTAGVYPLQAAFEHIATWWGHLIHAF